MPWKENRTMDLCVQLVEDYYAGESIAALAWIYEVSCKTVYQWLDRHAAGGIAGLADRSRMPHASPGKLSDEMIAHIVAARQRWHGGPRKLRVKLVEAQPH